MSNRKVRNSFNEQLIDFSNLLNSLNTTADWIQKIDTKQRDFQQDITENIDILASGQALIPKLEADVGECCDNMTKMQEQMMAWQDRFTSLEEKYDELSFKYDTQLTELNQVMDKNFEDLGGKISSNSASIRTTSLGLNQQMKDHNDEIDIKFDALNADVEAKIALIQQETVLNYEKMIKIVDDAADLDEGQDDVFEDMEKDALSIWIQSPDRFSSPAATPRASVQLDPRAFRDVKKFKKLHLRILNLERRMATDNPHMSPGHRGKSNVLNYAPATEQEKYDLDHELHLKLASIMHELNNVNDYIAKAKKIEQNGLLQVQEIPDFDHYVPYMDRITRLEDQQLLLAKSSDVKDILKEFSHLSLQIESHNDLIEELQSQAKAATRAIGRQNALHTLPYPGQTINTDNVNGLVSPRGKKIPRIPSDPTMQKLDTSATPTKSQENQHSTTEVAMWIETTKVNNRLVREIPTRVEVEQMLTDMKVKIMQGLSENPRPRTGLGRAATLPGGEKEESLAQQFWVAIDAVNQRAKEQDEHFDQITENQKQFIRDELNQRLELIEKELKLTSKNFELRVEKQFEDFKPNPRSSRIDRDIHQLRDLVYKTQRTFNETLITVQKLELAIDPEDFESEEDMVLDPQSGDRFSQLVALITKNQNAIRGLSAMFKTQQSSFENITQYLEKQHDIQELEELKVQVQNVMKKQSEPGRAIDAAKLKRLHELLAEKGDRTDMAAKVDKHDLRKVQTMLHKKIESLQNDLKKVRHTKTEDTVEWTPLGSTKNALEHCFSCGTDLKHRVTTSNGDWRSWGSLPKPKQKKPLSLYGPGFSNILKTMKNVTPGNSRSARNLETLHGATPLTQRYFTEDDDLKQGFPRIGTAIPNSTRN